MGKVRSSSSEGVRGMCSHLVMCLFISLLIFKVSLTFFDDIIIPPQSLQHPKRLYPPVHEGQVHVIVPHRGSSAMVLVMYIHKLHT